MNFPKKFRLSESRVVLAQTEEWLGKYLINSSSSFHTSKSPLSCPQLVPPIKNTCARSYRKRRTSSPSDCPETRQSKYLGSSATGHRWGTEWGRYVWISGNPSKWYWRGRGTVRWGLGLLEYYTFQISPAYTASKGLREVGWLSPAANSPSSVPSSPYHRCALSIVPLRLIISSVKDSNRIRTLDCYVSPYKKTKLEGPSSLVCTEGSHIPEPSPLSGAWRVFMPLNPFATVRSSREEFSFVKKFYAWKSFHAWRVFMSSGPFIGKIL